MKEVSKRKQVFPLRLKEGSRESDIAEANGSWR